MQLSEQRRCRPVQSPSSMLLVYCKHRRCADASAGVLDTENTTDRRKGPPRSSNPDGGASPGPAAHGLRVQDAHRAFHTRGTTVLRRDSASAPRGRAARIEDRAAAETARTGGDYAPTVSPVSRDDFAASWTSGACIPGR